MVKTSTTTQRCWWGMLAWSMCSLGALFYCYEYLLRIFPSIITSDLMGKYHLSAAALGNLVAYYYYIYAPMQMPVGVLMDRYGPRRLLTMAGLCCAVGAYLFASTQLLWVAQIGRFLVGFGSAFAFVGVLKLATIWMPPERFGLISGMSLTLGMIGAMLGDTSLTALVKLKGWEWTSYASAVIGLVLAVVMFLIIRDKNKYLPAHPHAPPPSLLRAFVGLLTIVRTPQIWINGAIGCLLYLPISAFAEMWGIPYMKVAYHMSNMAAAGTVSMIFFGMGVGGPLAGLVSDRIRLRRMPMTVGAIVALIILAGVLYAPGLSRSAVGVLFFLFGLVTGAQVLVFAVGREMSPTESAGTAIALTNAFVMVGGMIFQPLVGVLLDYSWSGGFVNGIHVYTAANYQLALAILPIGILVAVFLTFLLRETHGRLLEEGTQEGPANG